MKMAGVCALRTLLIALTYYASADRTDHIVDDNHDAKECDLDINADQYLIIRYMYAHLCLNMLYLFGQINSSRYKRYSCITIQYLSQKNYRKNNSSKWSKSLIH